MRESSYQKSLHDTAINLTHRGSHPGQTGLERRLRYHFFFHNIQKKVQRYVSQCLACQTFSEKKTMEPIQSYKVPSKCWEQVAVDLFGPMPSSHHIVVVQDMASRYPAAKLVTSTKAEKVIPAIQDIYNEYGNPARQLSDNGTTIQLSRHGKLRQITKYRAPEDTSFTSICQSSGDIHETSGKDHENCKAN